MSILHHAPGPVQCELPLPFPDVYPDECPELPDADFFEPSPEDLAWLFAQDGGGWVEGESSPHAIELFTLSAFDFWVDELMPEPEPWPSEYSLF